MEKKKLLKRLSALGFAMYECRLYCDTHPNDTEALQMLNDYKSKYKSVKAEFEKEWRYRPKNLPAAGAVPSAADIGEQITF
mgnify:CR=1 FL=1